MFAFGNGFLCPNAIPLYVRPMSIERNRLWLVIAAAGLLAVYLLAGPWKTDDEQQFESLTKIATGIAFRERSSAEPLAVARCLLELPHTTLNLDRIFAGPGVTLANPVQHMLVTIVAKRGGSVVTVWRPPARVLRTPHRKALSRCTV